MDANSKITRRIFGVVLAFILVMPGAVLGDSLLWAPPPLAALIEEGLRENKDLQSLQTRVESLRAEIPFAGSLNDPRLGVSILNLPADSFRFDREPMTQKQISVAQRIPWFGELDLRSQRAALTAARLEAQLNVQRFAIARMIADSFYDLGFIVQAIRTNDQLTAEVNQLLRVAETRYATGRGLQQDVLQAQVELAKLLDESISLKKRRRVTEDRINELLNRDEFVTIEPLAELPLIEPEIEALQVKSRVLSQNPELLVRQADIRIADIDVELARKDYWPDFDIMVAYGQRDEDRTGRDLPDFVSGSVVMTIPLWQNVRQDPKLESTLKARSAAAESHRALLAALPHRVDALSTEIRETRQNYDLFKSALLLQADQWARSSQSAYEVGSVEFNTMIAARIQLLRFELQAKRYLFELYKKRTELEQLLGGPIGAD